MYPKKFENLINMFEKLPGVGAKTAQRYAFKMLESSDEEIEADLEAIRGIKKIGKCEICGMLKDDEGCVFCKDISRSKETILVVAYPQEAIAIEKTGNYRGQYHILNGVISASKGVYPEDIGIDALLKRIDGTVKEIIIATSATMDGEMTALYLDKVLKERSVLVTRLAHGLPMGSSLDYADDLTLIKAINNRTKIEQ